MTFARRKLPVTHLVAELRSGEGQRFVKAALVKGEGQHLPAESR